MDEARLKRIEESLATPGPHAAEIATNLIATIRSERRLFKEAMTVLLDIAWVCHHRHLANHPYAGPLQKELRDKIQASQMILDGVRLEDKNVQ